MLRMLIAPTATDIVLVVMMLNPGLCGDSGRRWLLACPQKFNP